MAKLQNRRLVEIGIAILETLLKSPDGSEIPEGHLYAPLMGKLNLDEFNIVIGSLVEMKLLVKKGLLLSLGERGKELKAKIPAKV